MTRSRWGRALVTGLVLAGLFGGGGAASAQDGGWTHWGGDERSTRYTPFDQIDAENFEDMEVAWLWRGDSSRRFVVAPAIAGEEPHRGTEPGTDRGPAANSLLSVVAPVGSRGGMRGCDKV